MSAYEADVICNHGSYSLFYNFCLVEICPQRSEYWRVNKTSSSVVDGFTTAQCLVCVSFFVQAIYTTFKRSYVKSRFCHETHYVGVLAVQRWTIQQNDDGKQLPKQTIILILTNQNCFGSIKDVCPR